MKRSLALVAVMVLAACDEDEPTTHLDGGDYGQCQAENDFVASHRACTTNADCTIVGSCSGGWGFRAVQASARAEAQHLSDSTACRVFDGPLYSAVCEQQHCVARPTGGNCGMPLRDGGSPDGG